jgi:hypothetical protein
MEASSLNPSFALFWRLLSVTTAPAVQRARTEIIDRRTAMRSVLGICLLIGLSASANAAATGHRKSRQVIARPGLAVIPGNVGPGGVRIYRDDSVPGGLRTDHDDPPAYDDPSKFSGG